MDFAVEVNEGHRPRIEFGDALFSGGFLLGISPTCRVRVGVWRIDGQVRYATVYWHPVKSDAIDSSYESC
jgi:hypothetical protein